MGDIKRQYRNDTKPEPARPQGSNPPPGKPSPVQPPTPREKG